MNNLVGEGSVEPVHAVEGPEDLVNGPIDPIWYDAVLHNVPVKDAAVSQVVTHRRHDIPCQGVEMHQAGGTLSSPAVRLHYSGFVKDQQVERETC